MNGLGGLSLGIHASTTIFILFDLINVFGWAERGHDHNYSPSPSSWHNFSKTTGICEIFDSLLSLSLFLFFSSSSCRFYRLGLPVLSACLPCPLILLLIPYILPHDLTHPPSLPHHFFLTKWSRQSTNDHDLGKGSKRPDKGKVTHLYLVGGNDGRLSMPKACWIDREIDR